MILDSQTNYLYLADSLPKKYPDFYRRFETLLSDCKIDFSLLPGTKDIWAVDYMPIQIAENNFTQFVYNPDYLQKEGNNTISDVDEICKAIGLETKRSDIKLDGGNVVKTNDAVVMTNKVFRENPAIKGQTLVEELKSAFQIENLVFIPVDPMDEIGHADGMVRFIDDKTVLINNYSDRDIELKLNIKTALHNANLNWKEIPYNPYNNGRSKMRANGIYINYLQMEDIIIVPTFNMQEDEAVVRILEDTFSGYKIKTVESNDIARKGGVLNCITWNIKK